MFDHALHACDFLPLSDGNYRAVTIRNLDHLGYVVWAGALRPSAIGKPATQITTDDHAYMQAVGFGTLGEVWEYFGSREYSVLIDDLRHQSGANRLDRSPVGRDRSTESPRVRLSWLRLLSTRARALREQPRSLRSRAQGV